MFRKYIYIYPKLNANLFKQVKSHFTPSHQFLMDKTKSWLTYFLMVAVTFRHMSNYRITNKSFMLTCNTCTTHSNRSEFWGKKEKLLSDYILCCLRMKKMKKDTDSDRDSFDIGRPKISSIDRSFKFNK